MERPRDIAVVEGDRLLAGVSYIASFFGQAVGPKASRGRSGLRNDRGGRMRGQVPAEAFSGQRPNTRTIDLKRLRVLSTIAKWGSMKSVACKRFLLPLREKVSAKQTDEGFAPTRNSKGSSALG
jgi:hypothetical protein